MKEYKNINEKIFGFFSKIIEHINKYYKNNPNFSNLELYLLGKIINETICNLKKNIQNQTENNKIEENSEISINTLIESLYLKIVPKYLESVLFILDITFSLPKISI